MKKELILFSIAGLSLLAIQSCKKEDPNAPLACFIYPNEVVRGIPAEFNSSCSENATSFLWNFGDGNTSTDTNPVHTFLEDGTFTVTLTVTDDAGNSDQSGIDITVMAPAFIEHSDDITEDETWPEGIHIITSDIYVEGAILTIAPGAIVRFQQGRGIYFGSRGSTSGATLIANGTADKPITFTSDALTKTAGDWDYIGFYDGASNNSSMQYCTVEYGGGYNDTRGMIYVDGSSVSIENCILRHSSSQGASLTDDGYFESFSNNTVEQVGESAIRIYGNYAHTIGTGNNLLSVKGIAVMSDQLEMESARWLKQTTAYFLQGDLTVGSETGSNLILDPGVEVRLGNGTAIYVGSGGRFGTLTAEGTANERIRFTSAAPDVSKSAGDWDMIAFYDGAGTGSSMDYVDVEYGGGYNDSNGSIFLDGAGLSFTNSTVSQSASQGISLNDDAQFTAFTGNGFSDNDSHPVRLYANFAHTLEAGNTFEAGTHILVRGGQVEQADVTWLDQGIPYLFDRDAYIGSNSGSTVTIEPGTTLEFSEGRGIWVGNSSTFGNLVADGEPGSLITFTSGAPAGFESAGDWDGIFFEDGTSSSSILDHCVISFGGAYSSNSGNISVRNETEGEPVISNCQITNSSAYGIYITNDSNPTLTDNIFSNNASGDTNQVK